MAASQGDATVREDDVVRVRVPPTFGLPGLRRLPGVDEVLRLPATSGTSVVADTDDLALARWGVRLTHDGDAWRLRLPPHPAGAVSPVGHRLTTSVGTVPAVARHALARLVDGRQLARVVRLVVRRRPVVLLAGDGDPLLQVTDEEVSVHAGRRLTGRFREVVLTPGPDARPALVRATEQAVQDAGGLGRETRSRTVKVLGPAAAGAPDLPRPASGDDATAAWAGALVAAVHDLLLVDVHLRLDGTGRVAAPSLPAVDAVAGLAQLLDAPAAVRAPLATLRTAVDEVADSSARLAVGEELGADASRLLAVARADRDAAVRRLWAHLDHDDHATAVRGLRDLAAAPRLPGDEAVGGVRASVAGRVGKRWAQLGAGLAPDTPAERASLAALAAGASVAGGKAPARFAKAATRAAAAATDHRRAVGVRAWLGTVATELPPSEAFAAGRLVGQRDDGEDRALAAWSKALGRLQRAKAVDWLERDAAPAARAPKRQQERR